MPRTRNLKRIDSPATLTIGGSDLVTSAETIAPPTPTAIQGPRSVAITTSSARSSQAPTAYIDITWDAPITALDIGEYQVSFAKSSDFSDEEIRSARSTSARLEVVAATTYYVRVRAVFGYQYSDWVVSSPTSITSASDATAPSVPTSPVLTFVGTGDAVITFTPSTSPNYRDTEIKIYGSSGGTLYATLYNATGRLVWSAAQNRAATSGTGDPSLYVTLASRSWSNVYSSVVNTGLVTKTAPTAPTVSADFTGANCVFTITPPSDAQTLRFVPDTGITARDIGVVGSYIYTFDQNYLDHAGTADSTLSWSFTATDGLGQSSTATTGTAFNLAPTAPSAVDLVLLFSGFRVDVTATQPTDFTTFRYRIVQTSPSASDVTVQTPAPSLTRGATTGATYQVGVKMVDVFGQASSETLSSTLLVDALSLATLRESLNFTDSLGTTPATLKAGMADDIRTTGGISYASNAGWVRWIQADWQILYRIKTLIVSMTPASGTTTWYIRTSKDSATWQYFSGPPVATGSTGQSTTLTSRADATTAQTNATSSTTLGNSTNNRVDLPGVVEARYIELWLRNTTGSTRVDEFFPRRLVQSEDMEAENVRAINIATGAVTTDKLTVPGTASIDAALQLIAFRVPVTLDTGSGIYQGSGTFASPTTGLKIFNSGGIGKLSTYNTGVEQVTFDTDGKLKAGGGNLIADSGGISILNAPSSISPLPQYGYRLRNSSGTTVGGLYGAQFTSISTDVATIVDCTAPAGQNAFVSITATAPSGSAQVSISAVGASNITLDSSGISAGGTLSALAGINVGSATGASTGEIRALRNDGGYQLRVQRTSATARSYGLAVGPSGELALDDITGSRRNLTAWSNGNISINNAVNAAGLYITSNINQVLNVTAQGTGFGATVAEVYSERTSTGSAALLKVGSAFKADVLTVQVDGKILLNPTTAGTAGALVGYITVNIAGTDRKIPYYAI